MRNSITLGALAIVAGCTMSSPKIDDLYSELSGSSNEELCKASTWPWDLAEKYDLDKPFQQINQAVSSELVSRGLDPLYCSPANEYARSREVETYNIDTLRVTTEIQKRDLCASGAIHKIILEGTISPDSSFAIEKLLQSAPHCRDSGGRITVATTVQLSSSGGYIVDGYKLGRTLREAGATTVIENGQGCASSCAVAFLGGKKRLVKDTGAIMFHAPYFSGQNAYGEKVIDCDVPKSDLEKLNDYYIEMVGKVAGDRLYERTMWYCSAEDGWVVSGGSAAELYDIATEKGKGQ